MGDDRLDIGLAAEKEGPVPEGLKPNIRTELVFEVWQLLRVKARQADAAHMRPRMRQARHPIVQQRLTGDALGDFLDIRPRSRSALDKFSDFWLKARKRGSFGSPPRVRSYLP